MLLGIFGVLLGLVVASNQLPYIPQLLGGVVLIALGGTAVALGFVGRKRARASGGGTGAATAGLVVGFVTIGLTAIALVTAVIRLVGEYTN